MCVIAMVSIPYAAHESAKAASDTFRKVLWSIDARVESKARLNVDRVL